MLPNSVSYCRAEPFKVPAAAPRPRKKGRFRVGAGLFYGCSTVVLIGFTCPIAIQNRPRPSLSTGRFFYPSKKKSLVPPVTLASAKTIMEIGINVATPPPGNVIPGKRKLSRGSRHDHTQPYFASSLI